MSQPQEQRHSHGHSHSHEDHGSHNHSHDMHQDTEMTEEQGEQAHLIKVISAFAHYKRHAMAQNHRRRRDYLSLSEQHKQLIPDYAKKINRVDELIEQNMVLLRDIVSSASIFIDKRGEMTSSQLPSPMDMDKVKSTLKQIVRDWSKQGECERKVTYDPIIEELSEIYKDLPTMEDRGAVRVLVPGAGLGRLAFDIAKSGFSCQGNEFSYYMLFASHFILNRMKKAEAYNIYPFVHSFSNHKSNEQQLSPIIIPDILPVNLPSSVDFSMVAGDFIEVYGSEENQGAWDVVVTCFFMDTAKNIMDYMQVIHKSLKRNGTWINIGPLLYHFEDSSTGEPSIELSLTEVKNVARKLGFEIRKERMIPSTYTSNPDGMLKYVYECAFWTAVKL